MRNKIIATAAGVAVALSLTGCVPTYYVAPLGDPSMTPRELLLQTVHQEVPSSVNISNSKLLDAAQGICDALDAGVTMEDIYHVAEQANLADDMAESLIPASVKYLCPEHR